MDSDLILRLIGGRVRDLRLRRGIAQQAMLAEKVKLTRASISAIESGKQPPSIKTLLELAVALECDPGDLLPSRREYAGEVFLADPNELVDLLLNSGNSRAQDDESENNGETGGSSTSSP